MLRPFALLACGAILFSFSFFNKKKLNKVTTIVIDAGHGGKDPGCNGISNNEKDVTLAVALKLGKLIEEKLKDVKVIYTRKTDVFVELEERAQIANRNNADLFISIHCNASSYMQTITVNGKKKKKEVINTKPYGSETYVMGIKNEAGKANVAKRENSAMLLEDNYKETYKGFDPNSDESYIMFSLYTSTYVEKSATFAANIQKEYKSKAGRIDKGVRRESLWVLWRTGMPSVLTEIGYLTNPEEEKFIAGEKGQSYLASAIFRAFRNYKNAVEGTNLKFDDELEKQEALQNENILKGDTAYLNEIEDYQDNNDTANMSPQEKLKALYKDGNKFFIIGDYNQAEEKYTEIKSLKPDDKTAKEKLAEIKKIRTDYKLIIDKADKLFNEKKFKEAKKIYDEAQNKMPKEKYATDKLKEIEKITKGEAPVQNDSLVIEKKYKDAIAQGDNFFEEKKYVEAIKTYGDASNLKPKERYPKDKMEECSAKLAEKSRLEELHKKYSDIIAKANAQFAAKDYSAARESYVIASALKTTEQFPKDKIAECDKLIADTKNFDIQYELYLKNGDSLMTLKKWAEAVNQYNSALKLKPNAKEPTAKIADCQLLMKEEKVVVNNYDVILKKADDCFLKKDYVCAINSYKEAEKIKPAEDYPKFQIRLSEKSFKWQTDNKAFMKFIEDGDEALKNEEFDKAIDAFQSGINFINGVTENKSKFKPTAEELARRIEDAKKTKEDKSKPVNPVDLINKFDNKIKSDSSAIVDHIIDGNVIELKVQFAQSEKDVNPKEAKYNGLEKVSSYKAGTIFKYTTGNFIDIDACIAYRDKVKSMGYKDAFIVAFKNGQRVEIKVVLEILNQRKKP